VLRLRVSPITRQCVSRFSNRASPARLSSCCQIRSTLQPRPRSVLFTRRSRSRLRRSFSSQKDRLDAGVVRCFGQLCQKHPSANTATRCFGKMKSGWPKTRRLRRHPLIEYRRNIRIRDSSVALFPLLRTRAMIRDLVSGSNTSVPYTLDFGARASLPMTRLTYCYCS
jgi:hypothetical protein